MAEGLKSKYILPILQHAQSLEDIPEREFVIDMIRRLEAEFEYFDIALVRRRKEKMPDA